MFTGGKTTTRGRRTGCPTATHPTAVVACARDNVHRLGLADTILVEQADVFPAGHADLAERLGPRKGLPGMLDGLAVTGRLATRPRHRVGQNPLAAYRAAETISLWRLTTD